MTYLFAGEECSAKRDRLGDPLQVLDRHIDFAALTKAVNARLVIGDTSRGGWAVWRSSSHSTNDRA